MMYTSHQFDFTAPGTEERDVASTTACKDGQKGLGPTCDSQDLSCFEPNEESLRAIRETEEMILSGSGRSFSSGRDLLAAALAGE